MTSNKIYQYIELVQYIEWIKGPKILLIQVWPCTMN